MTDDELNNLIDKDPVKALCYVIEKCGLTMTLYGKPVTEGELRAHAEELVDAKLAALVRLGKEP